MITINKPSPETAIPPLAVRLFSVLKLNNPKPIPKRLAVPPQSGIIAAQRLMIPIPMEMSA